MEWSTLTATLIAIGAFVVSALSLYISFRKGKFEHEVVISDQKAVLLLKIGEHQVNLLKTSNLLSKLHKRYSENGNQLELHTTEQQQKIIDLMYSVIQDSFYKTQDSKSFTYSDIKTKQNDLDLMNSLCSFIIQWIDERLKENTPE